LVHLWGLGALRATFKDNGIRVACVYRWNDRLGWGG
jgi:hypothetical protein